MKILANESKIGRRVQSGGCAIHCQDCSISQLCIPFTLNEHELNQLDNIIERKNQFRNLSFSLKRAILLNLFMLSAQELLNPTRLVKQVKNKSFPFIYLVTLLVLMPL